MFKEFLKAKAGLPILLGLTIGVVLFMLGDADDAPGLSFIGLAAGFLLIMRGIYYTGVIQKGYHIPIILLIFAIVAMIFPLVLLLDGELEGLLIVAPIGVIAGVALVALALAQMKRAKNVGDNLKK